MTTLEIRVNMDCPGCESKIKKALQKLDGGDYVEIDMEAQKVTVTGYAEQEDIMKIVRRNGRSAELWPFADDDYSLYYDTNPQQNHIKPTDTYYVPELPTPHSSFGHGYEQDFYRMAPQTITIDEDATAMFNDDNTSACAIM